MVDACYLCRRTQGDLDHLNEEIRTRVYLAYFSNARAQLDERKRRISFLQRLKDEESADPHFRIAAAQVFGDPPAYKKLMPWIDTLIDIASPGGKRADVAGTMGELVESLLAEERTTVAHMEEGLNRIRSEFTTGGKAPLTLHPITRRLPVEWSVDTPGFSWRPSQASDAEPLRRDPDSSRASVEVPLFICTACRQLLGGG
jgi:hypothetical protein